MKGPPKLPKDVLTLGMAVQDGCKVVWQYTLLDKIVNSIARRQPVGPADDITGQDGELHRRARGQIQ